MATRLLVGQRLRDPVHRECARACEPACVAGALMQLEEGVAVAAGAMAQVRALHERARGPGGLACSEQHVGEPIGGELGQADHEAGRAVAELHEQAMRLVIQVRQLHRPVRAAVFAHRGALDGGGDHARPGVPIARLQQVAAADQHAGGRGEAMHGVEEAVVAAVQVLRPIVAAVLFGPQQL